MTTAVSIRGMSKRFGATQALDDVDLDVTAGRVLALLGQNGAGKSTVIKILAGVHTADEGVTTVGGLPLEATGARAKMAFIHQDLGLVAELSIAENVALGTGFPRSRGLIAWSAVRRVAEQALAGVGADLDPSTPVADLSRTERSLVAIGRALVVDAEVLVLDEPTASLPINETHRLFEVIRRLRGSGLGIVYVSHRLDEVFEVADDVAVLRDGRVVGAGPISEQNPESIVRLIVGRTPPAPRSAPAPRDTGTALTLHEVVGERVGPVSLSVARGEVLGLVGLAGAGMTELGRGVAGALPIHSGEVQVGDRPHRPGTLRSAVRAGISFVTSNRMEEALGPTMTVLENLVPNPQIRGHGLLQPMFARPQEREARELIATFGVQPTDPDLPVTALSGGNQQKVVLGRWLSTDAEVLILEEPTAGVDVGAKADLYALLDAALSRGVGVLLISTDVEEVANVCHRALVFKDGHVVDELPRDQLTVERLVALSSGARDVA